MRELDRLLELEASIARDASSSSVAPSSGFQFHSFLSFAEYNTQFLWTQSYIRFNISAPYKWHRVVSLQHSQFPPMLANSQRFRLLACLRSCSCFPGGFDIPRSGSEKDGEQNYLVGVR
jgi:hypothetical protein